MIDLLDSAAPLVAAMRTALGRPASHRLLRPVLFFVVCIALLLATSLMMSGAGAGADRGPGGMLGQARHEAWPAGVSAYLLPSLQVVANLTDTGQVSVRLDPGGVSVPAGLALYSEVAGGLVDTVVIEGSVWGAVTDATLPQVLNLTSTDRSTEPSYPLTTSQGKAWVGGWGTAGEGALVLAFKGA